MVEDNAKIAASVEAGLRDNGYITDVISRGFEGEEAAAREDYDIVLLDLMLPDQDGINICRNLRRRKITTPIIMMTSLSETDDKVTGLNAGADDYITKPFEFEELLARIRAQLRRGQATESRTLQYEDLELDLYTRVVSRGDRSSELSGKEFALLEYLMRNPNRVLTRSQIGEKVWDINYDRSSNVIDVFISLLRKKVDRFHDVELIHTVKGVGYRFGARDLTA